MNQKVVFLEVSLHLFHLYKPIDSCSFIRTQHRPELGSDHVLHQGFERNVAVRVVAALLEASHHPQVLECVDEALALCHQFSSLLGGDVFNFVVKLWDVLVVGQNQILKDVFLTLELVVNVLLHIHLYRHGLTLRPQPVFARVPNLVHLVSGVLILIWNIFLPTTGSGRVHALLLLWDHLALRNLLSLILRLINELLLAVLRHSTLVSTFFNISIFRNICPHSQKLSLGGNKAVCRGELLDLLLC